jgi:hypothetical protein
VQQWKVGVRETETVRTRMSPKLRLERAKEKVGSEADLLHFEGLTDRRWKSVMAEHCRRDQRSDPLFVVAEEHDNLPMAKQET